MTDVPTTSPGVGAVALPFGQPGGSAAGAEDHMPEGLKYTTTLCAFGARLGLTTGFAMLPGLLASWLAPVGWAGATFVVVAATTWPAYW